MSPFFIIFSILALSSSLFMMYAGIRKMLRSEINEFQNNLKDLSKKQAEDHQILQELASRK